MLTVCQKWWFNNLVSSIISLKMLLHSGKLNSINMLTEITDNKAPFYW